MTESKPKLGIIAAGSYMVGNVVGSGIFISPTVILAQTGTIGGNLLTWVVCGVITILGSLAYIELGTSIPLSGGDYSYLCYVKWYPIAFGVAIVSIVLSWPGSMAVLAGVFGEYVLKAIEPWVCIPDDQKHTVQTLVAICFLLVMAAMNFGKLDAWLAKFQIFTTFLKIGLTLVIVLAGLYYAIFKKTYKNFDEPFDVLRNEDGDEIHAAPMSYVMAMYGGFWAYVGWDALNNGIEEIENPARTLPIAVTGSLVVITVIYVLVNSAYLAVLGGQGMLESTAVAQTFTQTVFGDKFALCVPFLIAIVVANTINSGFYTGSRYLFVVARQGHLPRFISLLHIDTASPRLAVTILTFLSIVLLLSGTVETLLKLVVFVLWLSHMFALCAVLYIRFNNIRVHPQAIRMPIIIHVTFLLLCAGLVVVPLIDRPKLTLIGLGLTVTAIASYLAVTLTFRQMPEVLTRLGESLLLSAQKLMLGVVDRTDGKFDGEEPKSDNLSVTHSVASTYVERF